LSVEERGLAGLEARAVDGTEVGRIAEVVTDEESGEVTHVVVEGEEERFEVPISAISLDAGADFATFHVDRLDEESEDSEHEGQFAADPESPGEAQAEEDLEAREDWEDETYTPDSGYPRNDAYVDPETGEEVTDPLIEENEGLEDDVEDLLADTDLEVRSVEDGVVELTGAATTREDLDALVEEITGLDGVLEVDTTDVDVG
jgi:sporulation protein YlmC with PRC-barrel domain